MTSLQNFASHSFAAYQAKQIRPDEDNNGLFCQIPDQSGKWMTVRCVESKSSVYASHCSCSTFAKRQACQHVELVQAYWNKLYKVEAPAPAPKKERKPRNGLVRKVRGGGLVRVEPVKLTVAKVIDFPVKTDISTKGNFGTKAFSILR